MAPPLVEMIPKSNQLERQWNLKLFPNLNEIDELFLDLFEPKGFPLSGRLLTTVAFPLVEMVPKYNQLERQ